MRSQLVDLWIRTRESYWFIPGLLAIGAVLAAVLLVRVDYAVGDAWLEDLSLSWLRINKADSAQALLATVAGSMITVAGVTFSMTLLAVSHATSQIGALLCIDQLGRGIQEMLLRNVPERFRVDASGKLRIIAHAVDHEHLLEAVAVPLHQYVCDDGIARARVVGILGRLERFARSEAHRELLRKVMQRFD